MSVGRAQQYEIDLERTCAIIDKAFARMSEDDFPISDLTNCLLELVHALDNLDNSGHEVLPGHEECDPCPISEWVFDWQRCLVRAAGENLTLRTVPPRRVLSRYRMRKVKTIMKQHRKKFWG